ncbi:MAG: ATP-binding protein [Chloroflexi bacterium]|nr:MAG: ATP-binding protein [Chloroflexota bacterium]
MRARILQGELKYMQHFVNREAELKLIDQATEALLDKQRLLRTPIVEFYGVEGIGKTTLLQAIEKQCQLKHVECLRTDPREPLLDQCFSDAKVLAKKKPVVVILDALDTANQQQLRNIETGLKSLIEESKLFVVLASRKMKRFDNTRAIAYKLTFFPLQPLTRESCDRYFASKGLADPKQRNLIFDWTHGYPLAMHVMIEALQHQPLDPQQEHDQKQLMAIIGEEVIDKKLLARVLATDLPWYHKMLTLLSVPRRFNLIMMQDLIERFAREYKLDSSLEYINLPNRINQPGEVISWHIAHSGYSIDEPIRHVFLKKLQIEDMQKYKEVHKFLADLNEHYAKQVTGADRILYLQELFYHQAQSRRESFPTIFEQDMRQIIEEVPGEEVIILLDQLLQDEEIKVWLGQEYERIAEQLRGTLAQKGIDSYVDPTDY